MGAPKKTCPVPFDQQPLNEYCELKASGFFNWSTLSIYHYIMNLLSIFSVFFILCLPLVLLVVAYNSSLWKILLLDLIIVNCIFMIMFIRLYLGWSYIVKRLISATIFYEESGWYDGQIWIKSIENLTKDRLIGLYEVTPFIQRIKYSLIVSIILLALDNIFYSLI